jgi:hypothetical protein
MFPHFEFPDCEEIFPKALVNVTNDGHISIQCIEKVKGELKPAQSINPKYIIDDHPFQNQMWHPQHLGPYF